MNPPPVTADLESLARDFWAGCGLCDDNDIFFPRNFELVPLAWPLALRGLPQLRLRDIERFYATHGRTCRFLCADRAVHGCIVAQSGSGLIFFNASDPFVQQQFTIAHEIAHFLLDYWFLRENAIVQLGDDILPVLNGEREATYSERLSGILAGVPLGQYIRLKLEVMDISKRQTSGKPKIVPMHWQLNS